MVLKDKIFKSLSFTFKIRESESLTSVKSRYFLGTPVVTIHSVKLTEFLCNEMKTNLIQGLPSISDGVKTHTNKLRAKNILVVIRPNSVTTCSFMSQFLANSSQLCLSHPLHE